MLLKACFRPEYAPWCALYLPQGLELNALLQYRLRLFSFRLRSEYTLKSILNLNLTKGRWYKLNNAVQESALVSSLRGC